MSAPGTYSATERLRDGREVEIRALRPDDRDDLLAAVGRTGTQSLQRRFFVTKRSQRPAQQGIEPVHRLRPHAI